MLDVSTLNSQLMPGGTSPDKAKPSTDGLERFAGGQSEGRTLTSHLTAESDLVNLPGPDWVPLFSILVTLMSVLIVCPGLLVN